MKPLDFVRTPKRRIAFITEVSRDNGVGDLRASIVFIGENSAEEKNAWWDENELKVIDNLASLLSRKLAHPFGDGKKCADEFYPKIPYTDKGRKEVEKKLNRETDGQ